MWCKFPMPVFMSNSLYNSHKSLQMESNPWNSDASSVTHHR